MAKVNGENQTQTRVVIPNTRECHKCPYNGKGNDYCWQKCKGPAEGSRKGKSLVNLGGIDGEGEYIHQNLDEETADAQDEKSTQFIYFDEPANTESAHSITKELKADTERSLAVVLANLFALTDTQLCILRHLLFGEDYATIGRTIPKPISKEAVHKCIMAMAKKHQFVENVMRQMQIKGIGGAKKKQAYNMEFEF